MCASPLNKSPDPHSIVGRLRAPRCGTAEEIACELDDACQEAATIISELQVERDDLLAKCAAVLWAIPDDVAENITGGQLRSLRDRAKAESSLSRIQSEVVERVKEIIVPWTSPATARQRAGEMTAQEMRTSQAILSSIRTASPLEVEILVILQAHVGYERDLHAQFDEHRHRGEWFKDAPEIRDFIRRAKKSKLFVPHRSEQ